LEPFARVLEELRQSAVVGPITGGFIVARAQFQRSKEALELFRAHERGLIRGAFIRVTETKLGNWFERDLVQLIYQRGKVVGVVIHVRASSRQPIKDFSGTLRAEIQPGDLVIRRFACHGGCEALVATWMLKEFAKYQRVWLRIWQEYEVDQVIVEQTAAQYVCTKVLAGSELVGIWCLGEIRDLREIATSEHLNVCQLRGTKLALKQALKHAKGAVLARCGQLVNHYSAKYNDHDSWSALALRGYGGRSDVIVKPAEMPKAWKMRNPEKMGWQLKDTPARRELPQLEPIIEAVPGVKHRIRIMKLAPGGEIGRHSDAIDRDAGATPGKLLRIHVPICTNSGVWFTSWDVHGRPRRVHMQEGEVWYLDTRKPHCVENSGTTDRLHLVMDVVASPQLLERLDPRSSSDISTR
jgi:Aspartyl/Asparaginyl beta-hydroxylase